MDNRWDGFVPLDPELRRKINKHFGGRVGRAFEALTTNVANWDTDQPEDLCGKADFYSAMRGDSILSSRAERIEFNWVCTYDKGNPYVAEIPEADAGLAGWIDREFGYVTTLRTELFSDWSYPTLRAVVKGMGTSARLKELRYRFHAYRAGENESRRTKAMEYCLRSQKDKGVLLEIAGIETARDEELKSVEDYPENIRQLYVDAIGRIRADERDRRQGEFDFPEDPA